MEDLEKTIDELTEKLKSTELKLSKQEDEAKSSNATVMYQTKPDKALRKFKEGDDVDDWIETTLSYISRLKKESEKVDMILNFLDRTPYSEVRFRIDRTKATSSEVLGILKKIYGEKDSWTRMQQNFYSRQQKVGESVDEYAHALIELILKMEKLNPSLLKKADVLLKERFAEGILDVSLRREMKRLNKERPDIEFYQIRDEANDWTKDESAQAMQHVTHEAVRTSQEVESSKLDNIMQFMQDQQKQMQSIEERMNKQSQAQPSYPNRGHYRGNNKGNYRGRYRGRGQSNYSHTSHATQGVNLDQHNNPDVPGNSELANNTSTTSTSRQDQQHLYQDPFICNYCKEPNHLERYCIKKRRDRRQNRQFSTNYGHSE